MVDILDWRIPDITTGFTGFIQDVGEAVSSVGSNAWDAVGGYLDPIPDDGDWWNSPVGNIQKGSAVASLLTNPALGAPQAYGAWLYGQFREQQEIAELEETDDVLQDRSRFLDGSIQEEQLAVATMFDVRDGILLDTAEALFNVGMESGRGRHPTRARNRRPTDHVPGSGNPNSDRYSDPAGGSRGGGRAAPKYVAPDRRTIEELVGDKMVVLTGRRRPELGAIVDGYMSDHKAAWEGGSVDPKATVLESIRNTAEYKRIHKLRGTGIDENTWVNSRQDRLTQLGLGAKAAEDRGIELAATGANLAEIQTGKFLFGKGRKDISMMRRLEAVAEQIGGVV